MHIPFSFLNNTKSHQKKFVVVGTNATAWSLNGNSWNVGSIPSGSWQKINYGGGVYMAVGTNCCATSKDGKTFTSVSIPSGSWTDCAYLPSLNRWVITRSSGAAGQYLTTDDNGLNFITRTFPTSSNFSSIAYGDGQLTAIRLVTSGVNTYNSTDGITWVGNSTAPGINWTYVSHLIGDPNNSSTAGSFAACGVAGNNRAFLRNTDAAVSAWTNISNTFTTPIRVAAGRKTMMHFITYNSAQFIFYDLVGGVVAVTSPQNSQWEDISVSYSTFDHSQDKFVCVSSNGANRIGRKDGYGAGWTTINDANINSMALYGVCFG